jgi:hypothetical protein
MVTIETSDGAVVQVPKEAATSGQISSGGLY